MPDNAIVSELIEQYDRGFAMLRELVSLFPEERWKVGMTPARWAYHAVQGTSFYIGDDPEAHDWSSVVDWQGDAANLPTQRALLDLLDSTQRSFHERWAARSDDEMLGPTLYAWTGGTRLSQLAYNLRHFTYHIGEVSMIARQEGASTTPWR